MGWIKGGDVGRPLKVTVAPHPVDATLGEGCAKKCDRYSRPGLAERGRLVWQAPVLLRNGGWFNASNPKNLLTEENHAYGVR
jgi:hypothetical protein